jgi:hypothetical protein
MRAAGVVVALAVLAACSSTEPAPAATADDVVAAWLSALGGEGDPGEFVIDGQLEILAALGRGDAAQIVESGLSAESAARYWSSFATGIEDVGGSPASALEIGTVTRLDIDDVEHVFVTVVGSEGRTTIVVRGADDRRIDMIATTGPALVRPLTTLLRSLPPDAFDGPAIASSLRAGLSDPDLDLPPMFYGETQDLIALIDR